MLRNGISESLPGEFIISTARSSGPGGQNVNKLNTKVEIRLNIKESLVLTQAEKSVILTRLRKRVNSDGELIVTSQRYRSQTKNRQDAIEKLINLLSGALAEEKERVPTKPTEKSRAERLYKKRQRASLKILRKSKDKLPDEL